MMIADKSGALRRTAVWHPVLLLLALWSGLAGAEVYRCTNPAGHVIYQSGPCLNGVNSMATGIDDRPEPVSAPRSWAPAVASYEEPGHPARRSEAAKRAFKKSNPCPSNGATSGPCRGWVIDHIKPLACGGADAPGNMQWQTVEDAKAKDAWERDDCQLPRASRARTATGVSSDGGGTAGAFHVGPRGGLYVMTSGGHKRYIR